MYLAIQSVLLSYAFSRYAFRWIPETVVSCSSHLRRLRSQDPTEHLMQTSQGEGTRSFHVQYTDKIVVISVVMQRQVPTIQTKKKTVEVPQMQYHGVEWWTPSL